MLKKFRKLLSLLLIAAMIVGLMPLYMKVDVQAAVLPDINYRAHVQDIGWMDYVKSGKTAGTVGQGKRMEALEIDLVSGKKSMIKYRAHAQSKGWMGWVNSGGMAGTTNEAKRIEAVQIKLTGAYEKLYDIYYRAHISQAGWMGWAKNGDTAGSEGYAMQMEAIEIKLVKKGQTIKDAAMPSAKMPDLRYKGHVQNIGWQDWVAAGKTGGTTGEAKRLEAMVVELKNFHGGDGIRYMAHVAQEGWHGWTTSGKVAGTTGKARAIEAVRIELIGYMNSFYDVYYRLHVKGHGWLGWAKNGEIAGTTGGGTRAEGIQIKLVVKDTAFNRQGEPYIDQTPKQADPGNSSIDTRINEFISEARWRDGVSWNDSNRPEISGHLGASGCVAYAADFVKYVYGKDNAFDGAKYYSTNEIRRGDVIQVNLVSHGSAVTAAATHTFVVLGRTGNELYVAEGNVINPKTGSIAVAVTNGTWHISGNNLIRNTPGSVWEIVYSINQAVHF